MNGIDVCQSREEKLRGDLLEELAALAKEQWDYWAKVIMDTEELSAERVERWQRYFAMSYDELPEKAKEQDRKWARKVLVIVEDHYENMD